MDFNQLFGNESFKQEFLDRFDEITAAAFVTGGFEDLEDGLTIDRATSAVSRMAEGTWAGDDPGLEAIIQRFARPVHLVMKATFESIADGFPQSEQVTEQLEQAQDVLEAAITSVGRIDLRNHDQLGWAGTGWMIGPALVTTNRYVADVFTSRRDKGFVFRVIAGKRTHAMVDWYQEYQQPEESRFRVTEIAWMEPDESLFDVALLRVAETGAEGETAPPIVELLVDEITDDDMGRWIGVIDYPGYDSHADTADQQRIYGGVYGYNRLAAGQVLAVEHAGLIGHDATTLGGSSGLALIDSSTGRAIALHFGGRTHVRNSAVSARGVQQLVREHGT